MKRKRKARQGTRAETVLETIREPAHLGRPRRLAPQMNAGTQPQPCPGAGLTPNAEDLGGVLAATLCLINRERVRYGERELKLNEKLASVAQAHSESMGQNNYFSHEDPAGSTPLSRMQADGYLHGANVGYEIGENIAWGTLWLATPRAIVESWMQSPEHRANILDPNYRDTGIGVYPRAPASGAEGQQGAVYTQDFGVIIAS